MSQLKVEAQGATRADPDGVWKLVANADMYPQWGPWDDGGYESGDSEGAHGVGSIQWFSTGRTKSVERIVEFEENRRLVYVVVRGIPVRNYPGRDRTYADRCGNPRSLGRNLGQDAAGPPRAPQAQDVLPRHDGTPDRRG